MVERRKVYAWVIGTGMVLFVIHNPYQPLIRYAFLPHVGLFMMVMGMMLYLIGIRSRIDWGPRKLWIPLLVIVACIGVSGIAQFLRGEVDLLKGFAPLVFASILFGLYLTCRSLKEDVFAPFLYAVVIGSLGCVVYGIIEPERPSGGIISPTNYDMAVGLLAFGTLVSAVRHRWWLTAVALLGLFFTGAPEGIFVSGVVFLAVLARRDWGKRLLVPVGLFVVLMIATFSVGLGQQLYSYAFWVTQPDAPHPVNPEVKENPIKGRIRVASDAMSKVSMVGHGYTVTDFTVETVHNVPLVIVQQVGPIAALMWLFVTLYCLVKTKWRYAWIGLMAMCVFDHYIWTQAAPWWWALVGVSTTSELKSDLIFRRGNEN